MYIVHVNIHVKPEYLDDFIEATSDNARHSAQEPGVVRFDFVQNNDDPTNFALVEIYRTPADFDRHKETAHYHRWRERATDMMTAPPVLTKYRNIVPTDASPPTTTGARHRATQKPPK